MTGRPEDRHRDEFSGALGWVLAPMFLLGRRKASRLVAQVAEVGPDDSLLDVGCGVGQAVAVAARCGATLLGVDPSPAMMRLARWAARHEPLARFAHGTADRLPVGDARRRCSGPSPQPTTGPMCRPVSPRPAACCVRRDVSVTAHRNGRGRWLAVQGSR